MMTHTKFLNTLLFSAFIFVILSCKKRATCDGTVYSSHGITMPGVTVRITYGVGNSYQGGVYYVTTNENGHFAFDKTLKFREHLDDIYINAQDSGTANFDLNKGVTVNNLSITLRQ